MDVSPDLHVSEECNSLLGLLQLLYIISDNQGEFRDTIDDVTLGLDKSWDARSSDGRDQSVTALVYIDLAVPATVGLSGSEHATTTAHVTESTLAGTVSTTTTNTGNTGNSTTSTPGFGRGLVAWKKQRNTQITLVYDGCTGGVHQVTLIFYDHFSSLTGLFANGIGLTLVATHQLVNIVDDIRADGSLEHSWQADVLILDLFILFRVHGDQRSGVG